MKRCPECQQTLPEDRFSPDRYRRDGLAAYCQPCATLVARRARKRTQMGTTKTGLIPAGPVREHLLELRREGMTNAQMQAVSGVDRTIIRNLLDGQPPRQGPAKRVRRENAERLLRITTAVPVASPTSTTSKGGVRVDATSTRRRLQALMANGWPSTVLAGRLGATRHVQVATRGVRVTSNTALAVKALYAELENTPGPSPRTARLYRSRGYLHPGWWDLDTIDNPLYEPDGLREYDDKGRLVDDLTAWRRDRVLFLAERRGMSVGQIAVQIDVPARYVRRDLRNTAAS